MKETLINLFKLVSRGILTSSSITLYLYYKLNEGQPCSLVKLKKSTNLSQTIIIYHNRIMEMLGLLTIERRRGSANIPHVHNLSNAAANAILSNVTLLSNIDNLKDNKIDIWHPRKDMLSHFLPNRIKDRKYIYKKEEERRVAQLLSVVAKIVPEKCLSSNVVPKHFKVLEKMLAAKIDIADYTKWFLKYKMGVTVKSFSLNIFLYAGIIEEYHMVKKKRDKVRKYKNVSTRHKDKFKGAANRLAEELLDE